MGASGGMKGSYGSMENIPGDVSGLREDVVNFLRAQAGGGNAAEAEFERIYGRDRMAYQETLLKQGLGVGDINAAMAKYDQAKEAKKQAFLQANPQGTYGKIFPTAQQATAGSSARVDLGSFDKPVGTTIGPIGQANYDPITAGQAAKGDPVAVANVAQLQRDKQFDPLVNMIIGKASGGNMAGQATAGQAASTLGMVQSIDQIVNSVSGGTHFKDNVMNPYRDMFKQTRNEGLAAARESSGNLTGSGFANILGTTVNRSMAEENKALSDVLTQLANIELQRQQEVADREQGRLVSNAGFTTQANMGNAANLTQANISGTNALSGLAELFSRESMDSAKRADTVSMFNSGESNKALLDFLGRTDNMAQFNTNQTNSSRTQQAIQNAQAETQRAIEQGRISSNEAQNYFNQMVAMRIKQGELDLNNNQFNTGESNKVGMFNAQSQNTAALQGADNFLRLLLGMTTTGVGAASPTYKPGIWDSFAQILPFLGTAVGSYYGARK